MRTLSVNYWINNIKSGKNNIQPHSKEEEIAYEIAEYVVSHQNIIAA